MKEECGSPCEDDVEIAPSDGHELSGGRERSSGDRKAPASWKRAPKTVCQEIDHPGSKKKGSPIMKKNVTQRIEEQPGRGEPAEQALGLDCSVMAALLETVQALVFVLDRRGRIVRFNKACESSTGYVFEEVKNRHIWDLFLRSDEIEPFKALFGQIVAGEFPCEFKSSWMRRDGSQVSISWSNTAFIDNANTVKYIIFTGVDMTEIEQAQDALRESEKRFRTLSALVQEGIVILNDRGRISFWNERAEEIFECCANQVLGKELHPLLRPNGTQKHGRKGLPRLAGRKNGGRADKTVTWEGVAEDGTDFSKELALSWLKITGAKQTIGVVRDMRRTQKPEPDQAVRASSSQGFIGDANMYRHFGHDGSAADQAMACQEH